MVIGSWCKMHLRVLKNQEHFHISYLPPHGHDLQKKLVFELEENAQLKILFITGGKLSSLDGEDSKRTLDQQCIVYLLEEKANVEIFGYAYASHSTKIIHSTQIYHQHSNTFSNQKFIHLVSSKGKSEFVGKIRVEKNIQDIQAQQLSKNILLEDTAHAISRPELEIYSSQVKCTHGSSTGKINPDHLYYLQSRGIPPKTALQLLQKSYLMEILQEFDPQGTKLAELQINKDDLIWT